MRTSNDILFNATSTTSTVNSSFVKADYTYSVSCSGVFTGSGVGVLKLQACNDVQVLPNNTPINFVDIPSATVAISGAGVFLIPKFDVCYQYMRAVYTASSGTGTMTVNLKTIGF